jgi:hypothetical protein
MFIILCGLEKMKNIFIIIFTFSVMPLFASAFGGENFTLASIVVSKPQADLSSLTKEERQLIKEIRRIRKNLPDESRREIKNYNAKIRKLRNDAKILYKALSDGSKQNLRYERKLKRSLSPKAKKFLESGQSV